MRSSFRCRSSSPLTQTLGKRLSFAVLAGFMISCGPDAPNALAPSMTPPPTKTESKEGSWFEAKVIYGEDNRRDYFEELDPAVRQIADSTVALFYKKQLSSLGDKILIEGPNFGTEYKLCEYEPYREQSSAAFCSGFLVAPDQVVTAGHCIMNESECSETSFVFGYAYHSPNSAPTEVAESEVYTCKKIIRTQAAAFGADYAVIQLDRAVTGHNPLALRRSGQIQKGEDLIVIGHPSGLPTKIADGAKVRNAKPKTHFVANLDTFGGNSGSAVFNAKTLEVEGILVRGAQDFKWNSENGCNESFRCPDDSCRGEHVTKISEVLRYISSPVPSAALAPHRFR